MVEVDMAEFKANILALKIQIEDSRQALHDKIERMRDNAESYERDAIDRHYAEIEPMRRQMEAMIQAAAVYESLKAPQPFVCAVPHKV